MTEVFKPFSVRQIRQRIPSELTHAAARHAQFCATLGADFWRVLSRPTCVVLARNGELALLPTHAEHRFKAGERGVIALRIGPLVPRWRAPPLDEWNEGQLAAAMAWMS